MAGNFVIANFSIIDKLYPQIKVLRSAGPNPLIKFVHTAGASALPGSNPKFPLKVLKAKASYIIKQFRLLREYLLG